MNSDKRQVAINVAIHMHKAIAIRCHATDVFPDAQTDEGGMFGNFTLFHQRLEIQLLALWVSPRFPCSNQC